MRYIVWIIYLISSVLHLFWSRVAGKTRDKNMQVLRRFSSIRLIICALLYIVLFAFDIGQPMNAIFTLISLLIYTLALFIASKVSNFFIVSVEAYNYLNKECESDVKEVVNKLSLLCNGVVAHKITKTDYIKTLDSYKYIASFESSFEERLNSVYERRIDLELIEALQLRDIMRCLIDMSKSALDKLIFMEDEDEIDFILRRLALNLSSFNLWLSLNSVSDELSPQIENEAKQLIQEVQAEVKKEVAEVSKAR